MLLLQRVLNKKQKKLAITLLLLTEIVEVENETWQGAKFGVC